MSEWISVKDRLPDAEEEVLLECKTKPNLFEYQCKGFYIPENWFREDSSFTWDYEACDEYNEEKDDYMVTSGWYERIHNWDEYGAIRIEDYVTHWMPFPEPPEEE